MSERRERTPYGKGERGESEEGYHNEVNVGVAGQSGNWLTVRFGELGVKRTAGFQRRVGLRLKIRVGLDGQCGSRRVGNRGAELFAKFVAMPWRNDKTPENSRAPLDDQHPM